MKKIAVVLLMIGLIGVSGAFAQFKPVLITNGVTLDVEVGAPYIFSHETSGNKVLVYIAGNPSEVKVKMIDNDGNTVWDHTSDTGGSPYYNPVGCETSNGNIIVAWEEGKDSPPTAIYAEKLIPSGGSVSSDWVTRVSTQTTVVRYPRVAPDSNDGAYVGFDHDENGLYYVYAQHLSSTGSAWSSDLLLTYYDRDYGHKLIAGADNQGLYTFYQAAPFGDFTTLYLVTTEGTTGSIVSSKSLGEFGASFDTVKAGDYYFIAQQDEDDNIRIYKAGSDLAIAGSAVVCNETGTQEFPKIVADADSNSANLYVCWNDYRSQTASNVDIYAQKYKISLSPQWTTNGTLASKSSGVNVYAYMRPSGSIYGSYAPMVYYNGDTYIAFQNYSSAPSSWDDISATTEADIYMQVLDSNGTTLATDLPICSVLNHQYRPEIRTSTPFIAWYDRRSGSYLQVNGQRVDEVNTQIASITTSPATSNMVIDGVGFGADPSGYLYSGVTYGSEYNHVSVDGTIVDISSWTPTAITFDNYTYNDFLAGSNNDATIEVMAYGDSDSFTLSKPSNVAISDIYFDGVAYTASGQVVNSNAVVTGEITSTYNITSASIEVDGSSSSLTLTNNQFSHTLSSLAAGGHTIIISAIDSAGGTGSTTCNVSVSSVITISDVKFGSQVYQDGTNVTGNTSFSCTIQSDYVIGNEIYISSGTGTGIEINVSTNYNPTTHVLNISDLGQHITLIGEVYFTLRAKDANNNEVSETFYVENPPTVQAKNVIAQPPESPSDDIIIAANIGGADLGGGGVSGTQAAAASQNVQIIIYGPAGYPVNINQPVTVGYNEFRIPAASVINSNGIYIVKIVYKGKVIAKTRFVVLW